MKQRNLLICLLLSFALLLSLTACGAGGSATGNGSSASPGSGAASASASAAAEESSGTDSSPQSQEPTAPVYKVALFPAPGEDQSVPEAGKAFCEAHKLDFVQLTAPAEDEHAAVAAVEQAVAQGCNVVVLSGQACAPVLTSCASNYPDVRFLTLDLSVDEIPDNVCCLSYREEEAGFMAGYMAVMQGSTRLAFLGRSSETSDQHYGSGFLQGVDCAAMEWGIFDSISVEYCSYEQMEDNAVTAAVKKLYQKGTEVVFATNHGDAVAKAAAKAKGLVIGTDADQSALLEQAGEGVTLTCAVKYPAAAITYGLEAAVSERWSGLAGTEQRVGIVSKQDTGKNAVGLSENSAWSFAFDEEDCGYLVEQLADRDLIVSDQSGDQLKLACKVHFTTLE